MRWLLTSLLLLQCATCGQKGPLTLPEQPAAEPDPQSLLPGPDRAGQGLWS